MLCTPSLWWMIIRIISEMMINCYFHHKNSLKNCFFKILIISWKYINIGTRQFQDFFILLSISFHLYSFTILNQKHMKIFCLQNVYSKFIIDLWKQNRFKVMMIFANELMYWREQKKYFVYLFLVSFHLYDDIYRAAISIFLAPLIPSLLVIIWSKVYYNISDLL